MAKQVITDTATSGETSVVQGRSRKILVEKFSKELDHGYSTLIEQDRLLVASRKLVIEWPRPVLKTMSC